MESRTNIKRLWGIINEIIGKKGNKETTIDAIKVDNILRYNPKTIANELGNYFSNVGRTYAKKYQLVLNQLLITSVKYHKILNLYTLHQ